MIEKLLKIGKNPVQASAELDEWFVQRHQDVICGLVFYFISKWHIVWSHNISQPRPLSDFNRTAKQQLCLKGRILHTCLYSVGVRYGESPANMTDLHGMCIPSAKVEVANTTC